MLPKRISTTEGRLSRSVSFSFQTVLLEVLLFFSSFKVYCYMVYRHNPSDTVRKYRHTKSIDGSCTATYNFWILRHLNAKCRADQLQRSLTYRLLVTERARRANFDSPAFATSSSRGCFSAVISRNVRRNSTTRSFSFLIGATCNSSHSGLRLRLYRRISTCNSIT